MTSAYDAPGIRECVRPFQFGRMVRLIPRVHRESPLGVAPTPSRFSDPRGKCAVLYAAGSLRCAFWETIARGRFTRRKRRQMRRQDIETRLLVWLCSTEPLALVDLRSDGPVRMGDLQSLLMGQVFTILKSRRKIRFHSGLRRRAEAAGRTGVRFGRRRAASRPSADDSGKPGRAAGALMAMTAS